MHFMKLWLPAFVGMFVSLAPASALPVPKLPPEATNKPSIVVRVRPLAELVKDAAYVAKMIGQDGVFDALEPGIRPIIDVFDAQKPIGFYAKVGPAGIDSHGVLLLPVKNQKDFLAVLNQFNVNPVEGENGLYSFNQAGAPFGIVFRFANGYVYGTMKNTPDAEASLSLNKIYPPEALFKQGDDSLFSFTLNVDAIPNDLKRMSFKHLEEGLRMLRENELPKIDNPAVRTFVNAVAEELATKVQSLVVDAQTATFRFDFERAKEDMGLSFRLTPRTNSPLANDIATISSGKSLGAGILSPNGAMNIFGNVAVPDSIKKALEPIIDDFVAQGWKKAKDDTQPFVKELIEILAPTMKAGILDFGADFRAPNAQKNVTVVAAVQVKDAHRLDALVRKVYAILPPNEKALIKLDVDKASGIALHQFPGKYDPNAVQLFGPDPQTIVAFRKDAIVLALGPVADATAAIKSALDTSPKTSPVLEGMFALRAMAPVAERKDPGFTEAAKKAYPAGVSDAYRVTVTGGQSIEIRFSASTRMIQFGMLLEQSRRNR